MDVPNRLPAAKPHGENESPNRLPAPMPPGENKPLVPRYRTPVPRVAHKTLLERLSVPPVVLILLGLIIGVTVGGFLIRQRYKSKEVIVSVNGARIRQSDFLHRLDIVSDVPPSVPAGPTVLRQMVNEILLIQFAKQHGPDKTYGSDPKPQEIKAEYDIAKDQPQIIGSVTRLGLSPDDVKQQLRISMAWDNLITNNIGSTPQEAYNFYRSQVDPRNPKTRYYTPERAQFAIIVTSTPYKALQAVDELKQGVDYNAVASKYSEDATKNDGGLTAVFERGRNPMTNVPGWEATAFSLQPGETVGPRLFVKNGTSFWCIIKSVSKMPAAIQPYKQVESECFLGAKLLKVSPEIKEQVAADFQDFKAHSKIVVFWTRYKSIFNQR